MSGGSEALPQPPRLRMAAEQLAVLQRPRQRRSAWRASLGAHPAQAWLDDPPDTNGHTAKEDTAPTCRVLEEACVRLCRLRQAQGTSRPDGRGPVATLAPQVGTAPKHGTVKDLGILLGTMVVVPPTGAPQQQLVELPLPRPSPQPNPHNSYFLPSGLRLLRQS